MSVLRSAWRVVARRALSDRAVLAAAGVAILLATVLVSAGPIYSDAVTLSATRRVLGDADVTEANIRIEARVSMVTRHATETMVDQVLIDALDPLGFSVTRRATSDSYALPVAAGDPVTSLALFRWIEGIEGHATLVSGAWSAGGPVVEAAVPVPAARLLELGVGDRLELVNRRSGGDRVQIRVAGVYAIDDAADDFWYGDELDTTGATSGPAFTTHGPFVVSRDALLGPLTPFNAGFEWRVFPAHENLEVSAVSGLRDRVAALDTVLNTGRESGNRFVIDTGLIDILSETERSLLVTRSTMLVMLLQFSLLAGYALFLTAGLLAESRQTGTHLLRARGASTGQALAMAAMEGVLLVAPAVVVAPPLAAFALRALNHAGPLADIGLTISPHATVGAFVVAAAVGLLCLGAIVLPAHRSAKAFGGTGGRRRREVPTGLAQRAGIDLALLAAAGIALWQLSRYGGPLTRNLQGRLGVDPLLVAAPALGLLAGAVVALRTVPLVSRVAERVMARGTAMVPVLGAWQVARRPRRYARTALFLTFAVAIGFVAVSYAKTWRNSQADQAAFQLGSDLVVGRDRLLDAEVPWRVTEDAMSRLPGHQGSVAVLREAGNLARGSSRVRFVMLDSARAAGALSFRPDLADDPLPSLMAGLTAARGGLSALPLPGEPALVSVVARLDVDPLPPDVPPEITRVVDRPATGPPPATDPRLLLHPDLRLVIVDGDDNLYRLQAGPIPEDGEPVRLVMELESRSATGSVFRPAYPLSVVAIEVRIDIPRDIPRTGALEVISVATAAEDARGDWTPVAIEPRAWGVTTTASRRVVEQLAASADPSSDVLRVELFSGWMGDGPVDVSFIGLRPRGSSQVEALPVLLSTGLMTELGLEVGDEVPLDALPGIEGAGVVTGTVHDFPSVDPLVFEPVVLDYQGYLRARYSPGSPLPLPDQLWIDVDDAEIARAAAALAGPEFSEEVVVDRLARESSLGTDPVAGGTIGSLMVGFVAAGVLALVGFAVNAAVSARERIVEFALLRATGLSRRQLWAWLTLESLLVILFSLAVGTVLGALLASVVLPLTTVTQSGAPVAPDLIVVRPWRVLVGYEGILLGTLLVSAGVLALVLRRRGLGALLRLGEE